MAIKTTAEWYELLTSGLLSKEEQQNLAAALFADFTTASAGGGNELWEQIGSRTSASSDATVSYAWATTYKMVVIQLNSVLPATDDVDLYIRTSSDGGVGYDSGAADYSWGVEQPARFDVSDAQIICNLATTSAVGNGAGIGVGGLVYVLDPANAAQTQIMTNLGYHLPAGIPMHVDANGVRLSAADVDGIQFSFSSGNIASGEFIAWGVK